MARAEWRMHGLKVLVMEKRNKPARKVRNSLYRSALLRSDPLVVDKQFRVCRNTPGGNVGVEMVGGNGRSGRYRSSL